MIQPPEEPGQVRLDRGRARKTGAVATAVALAFLWVAAGASRSVVFPPTSLAGALVRETPGDVATFFIELLGHWALRLTTVAALAGAVLVGAEALVRTARRDRLRPWLAGAVLGIASAAAAAVEPSTRMSAPAMGAVLVVAAALYALLAGHLYGRTHDDARVGAGELDLGRRRVLQLGSGGALALAVGGGVVGWFLRRMGGPDRNVPIGEPIAPATLPPRGSFPEVAGHTEEVTSAADHYVVDVNLIRPTVEVDGWTLTVDGEVEAPLELTFEGMQADFDLVEDYSVLTCISNEVGGPLVGHSAWRGVRLADVLDRVTPRSSTVDVVFRAADGYTDSIPLEVAQDPAVILAIAQNGEPLTRDHGFPCRVRIPAIYGMKNVKWVQAIEVVDVDYKGYWMRRGWSDRAVVKTQSRIDVVGGDEGPVAGAQTWIAGVAWAGDRGVSAVEVSTDGGGTWNEAELKEPINDEVSWRLWAYRWTPERAGDVVVMCRAVDGTGEVQDPTVTAPHPAGAGGYHSVTASVA
ncbi:MAG TPA: molybdopterin-dependent oxidoreductase [Actinomycetota bacterium]|nr:molybdopterin-dependent oxidoreductase [Actinomycetota bacterium]